MWVLSFLLRILLFYFLFLIFLKGLLLFVKLFRNEGSKFGRENLHHHGYWDAGKQEADKEKVIDAEFEELE